ncbi:MAG: ADOP family duplicated permease [Longimicrobiales bacterium]
MDWWRGLKSRLRTLVRRGAVERELDDEVRLHVELETEAGVARGLSPDAARRAALSGFGGVDRYKEEARDARGWNMIDEFRRDGRLALRLLRRSPQFTLAAVLTLALGIGANTAIFSVVDGVLLRASPFAEPERLVMIWETDRDSETSHEPASWPDVVDMRERSRTMSAIGSVIAQSGTLTGAGEPERLALLRVTPNVPDLLGVRPILGRTFAAGEGQLGGAYALLSEEFWRRRFAADAGVLGRSITIDGQPTAILGVMPAEADLGMPQVHAKADYSSPLTGTDVDVWIAVEPTAASFPRQTHPFLTLGRLAPNATLAAAQRELAAIMTDLEQAFPENTARGVNLEPYADVTFGPVRPALLLLLSAVALVLLVACVNVANLLLARTAARSREVSVRRALGAATGRLARQFLVESLALTGLGAAAGVALAYLALNVLIALAPADIPRLATATIDLRVLGFTALIAVVVAIGFGMLPVLQAGRLDLQSVLKTQPGRRVSEGREGRRFRSALVVAEVALAVTLVIGAGVLLRSFWTLASVDPGFETAQVLKVEYQLPATRYPGDRSRWPDLPAINGFHAELLRRVRALPGVEAAAIAARHPLDPGFTNSFVIVGREAESQNWPEIRTRFMTHGYLETVGVPLIQGRDLAEGDVAGATPVAVINSLAAERYFAGADPIGQQLQFWGVSWQIVGVIGNERFNGVDEDTEPAVYTPLGQAPQASAVLLVRGSTDPRPLLGSVRRVFSEMDAQLALSGVETLEQTLSASIAKPRFTAILLALFGGVAILLAMVGVHGVLSYTVAQRAPEVGIRMALGASRAEVIRMVVREGAGLAALGTILGLVGALAGSRALSALVFGVSTRDAATFGVVTAAVLSVAVLAAWLPARRAARTEPMQSLRAE